MCLKKKHSVWRAGHVQEQPTPRCERTEQRIRLKGRGEGCIVDPILLPWDELNSAQYATHQLKPNVPAAFNFLFWKIHKLIMTWWKSKDRIIWIYPLVIMNSLIYLRHIFTIKYGSKKHAIWWQQKSGDKRKIPLLKYFSAFAEIKWF